VVKPSMCWGIACRIVRTLSFKKESKSFVRIKYIMNIFINVDLTKMIILKFGPELLSLLVHSEIRFLIE
jgi:hypothetical protein